MDPLQRFGEYAADFEKTFEDNDWSRLEPYFDQDAIYSVSGSPFDCEIRGRDAVLVAIRKAVDGFDRRFDRRAIEAGGEPETEGNRIVFHAIVNYEKEGLAPLSITLSETAEFDESGRIVLLRDDYAPGQDEVVQWLADNSTEFDPTYE